MGEFNEKLLRAAAWGDLQGVLKATADGADINTRSRGKETPFMLYLRSGRAQPSDIATFVSLGADLNVQDRLGYTAVASAAREGILTPSLLDALSAAGADLNIGTYKTGDTPLLLVAKEGYLTPPLLEAFCKGGANPRAINKTTGRSIADMTIGTIYFSLPLFRMFAKYGVPGIHPEWEHDLNARDGAGNTALHWCAAKRAFDINLDLLVNFLFDGADPNAKDNEGENFLMTLSRRQILSEGHISVYLKWGGEADARNKENRNLLFFTAGAGATELLLGNGADPCVRSTGGDTVLTWGAKRGFRYETMLALCRGGGDPTQASVSPAGEHGELPLFIFLKRSSYREGMRLMAGLLNMGLSFSELTGAENAACFLKKLEDERDKLNPPYNHSGLVMGIALLAGAESFAKGLQGQGNDPGYWEEYFAKVKFPWSPWEISKGFLNCFGSDSLPDMFTPHVSAGLLIMLSHLWRLECRNPHRVKEERFVEQQKQKELITRLLTSCFGEGAGNIAPGIAPDAVEFIKTCLGEGELGEWAREGVKGVSELTSAMGTYIREKESARKIENAGAPGGRPYTEHSPACGEFGTEVSF